MKRTTTYIYLILVALYVFMIMLFPMDEATLNRRGFSLAQGRLVSLAIAIPIMIIWFVALRGAAMLSEQAHSIKKSSDGPPLMKLATGVQLLAWYLPVRVLSKIIFNYLASLHPGWQNTVNIMLIYLHLIIPFIAFIIISRAAFSLTAMLKYRSTPRAVFIICLSFAILSVTFCYATFTSRSNGMSTNWLVTTQEAIPMPLRVATVVIPYLFMWAIGIIAVYQITTYRQKMTGLLYRRSLRLLSVGLVLVIGASISMQFVTDIAIYYPSMPMAAVFGIVYGILAVIGVAFGMIASGVQQFKLLDGATV